MPLKARFLKRTFHFGFSARTSRGAMRERNAWFIKIGDEKTPGIFGIGECSPLPGLSLEDMPGLEALLAQTVEKINTGKLTPPVLNKTPADNLQDVHDWLVAHFGDDFLRSNPAVNLAMEMALLDLAGKGARLIFDNTFAKGQPIPINGLVWMGGLDFMLQQVEIKIRDGFRCIKIKVGGLDFERECDILQYVRRKYFRDKIIVRLDANGSFKSDEAMYKLNSFARFDIHSIEQPVKTGSGDLAQIARDSPIPIALDEELIAAKDKRTKEELLDRIMPKFIILKPTLHGGFFGCNEWITIANERKIGWWITSALESNIGLNAVSQFAANYPIESPQGLGTGSIFTDNFASPLQVDKGFLSYNQAENWDLDQDFQD